MCAQCSLPVAALAAASEDSLTTVPSLLQGQRTVIFLSLSPFFPPLDLIQQFLRILNSIRMLKKVYSNYNVCQISSVQS